AMADRVVEPDLYQALADRERDEALRRLARNAHLGGDFLLGIAGHVIEPAGARGIVQAVCVCVLSRCHGPRPCCRPRLFKPGGRLQAFYEARSVAGWRAMRVRAVRMSRSVSLRWKRMASAAARALPARMQSRMR